MLQRIWERKRGRNQRGASLAIVGASLVALLAVAGLAVDLASLYVARSEAQRAADAAALAGANVFISPVLGCISSGCSAGGSQETPARQQAEAVGGQNPVGGQAVIIPDGNITFAYPTPQDPEITVVVQQTVPTFFMRVFGLQSENISASATAEAYTPTSTSATSPGGANIGTQCVKPWLMPNCDYGHPLGTGDPAFSTQANQTCPTLSGKYPSYFVYPGTNQVVNPGPYTGGVIGEPFLIKPGDPSLAAAPSQFYPVNLNPNATAKLDCPACASGTTGGSGIPAGSTYAANIACCNLTTLSCGSAQVTPIVGNKTGETAGGVECLINEGGTGQSRGSGQDILDPTSMVITGGSNNPLPSSRGVSGLQSSSSLVTVPIYDGCALTSGMGSAQCSGATSGTPTVTIVGFLQLFIKDVTLGNPQGNVDAYVYSVAACSGSPGGTGSGAGGGTITATGGSTIPVRLIHN